MVPPDSHGISRAPCYLGDLSSEPLHDFSYGGLTLYAGPFACPSPIHTVSDSPTGRQTDQRELPQPRIRNPCRVSHAYGLASSGFARHYSRNHGCFLFLRVLRCFTSPRSLHMPYVFRQWVTAHDDCRVSPFGHPRIKARLTAPRGLSWPPTSFIGSWCQGIHRAPLKTWPQMLASTVQFSNNDQPPITPADSASSLGPATEGTTLRPFPQTPNSVPDPTRSRPVFHARSSTHSPQPERAE